MKTAIYSLAVFLIYGWAQAGVPTRVPIDHVYAPKGFDSNDDVEIVAEGYLPNFCYKAPKAKTQTVGRTIYVEVTAVKETPADETQCAQATVPFLLPVSLGVLDQGNYKVVVNQADPTEVKIEESTSSAIDDYIYANVDYIEKSDSQSKVMLKGYTISDCFEFDRMETISNGVDTYSILPIMKQVSDFCPRKMVAFEYEYEVPMTIDAKKVLLHVRKADGKSVNTLFSRR